MGLFVPFGGSWCQEATVNEFRIPFPVVAINESAKLARSGGTGLVRAHIDALLTAFFPSSTIPEILKVKLSSLEVEHRTKGPRPVREADVVRALNAFADRIGAPEYAKTSLGQFRYVRVSLLLPFPEVIAGGLLRRERLPTGPEGLPPEMSPAETALVVAVLIQRKLIDETYQVTSAEWRAWMRDPRSRRPRLTQPAPPTLRGFEESERAAAIRKSITEYAARLGPWELHQEMERFVAEVYNAW